jgi:hypothetical protein
MRKHLLAVALSMAPVLAQANAVPGLDILMYELTDISFYGRRGTAPNGEAGFMVGHSWCNRGTVDLPWVSQSGGLMVDRYPRIAFLLARESGGRLVQVSGRSFCKHSPVAFNFSNGPCAPCNSGGGGFFYVGCSDTYGSGTNASQFQLGPTEEIDPWLGTWDPRGSYFDRGDPAVAGAAAVDSARSLSSAQVQAFDAVKNRMIVRESELLAGATYYGQVQAVVQGEPVANRGNNVMNSPIAISGSGGSWSASTTGSSASGSVLTRWPGATHDLGGNGTDDGRFVVAVKVTGPVGGMWHYEYAIHNLDNNRGGASFRIPTEAGAVVQNAGFRDLDTDPLNDWTFSHTGNEIVFAAAAGNPLEWNTIYNCWFDCSVEPGAGDLTIDQARPGPGALSVAVGSRIPSGLSFAAKVAVGAPCGACQSTVYERFNSSSLFDLAGRSMTMSLGSDGYSLVETPVAFVPAAGTSLGLGFNTQVSVNLPFVFPYPGGSTNQVRVCSSGYVTTGTAGPQASPLVSSFLAGAPRWAGAWMLHQPNTVANVLLDANATRVVLTWNAVPVIGSSTTSTFQMQFFPDGTVNVVWQQIGASTLPVLVGWSPGGTTTDPGTRDLSATLSTPLSLCGVPFDGLRLDTDTLPELGTTVQWQVSGIRPGTAWGALLRSLNQATPAFDLTAFGMPGCFLHVVAPVTTLFVAPGVTANVAETIPNSVGLVGVTLVGQAMAFNPPLTPAGVVASNGVVLTLGL